LRAVEESGRGCVVKTGTGSGKTEAFLLPVINGVLKLREEGVPGTKAFLIYPMNALANDQLARIRELVRGSGLGITFAMYTGESESVATGIGDGILEGNELHRRADIRASPPDIILTNYKQLEYLLVRNSDRALFSEALRYLVLDEIHSYRGALATEIACLIRRLKAQCGLAKGALRCLGTSATVAEGAGGDVGLAKFVSDLFAEDFGAEDIIGEEVRPRTIEPDAGYLPPFPSLTAVEVRDCSLDDPAAMAALVEKLIGRQLDAGGSITQRIATAFAPNRFVHFLEETCARDPYSITELISKSREAFPESGDLPDESWRLIIESYLILGSIGDRDDPPILRPKLHAFYQGVYDVGLCMNPDCRTLVRHGAEKCPACSSAVRPAALCRTCGQDFVKVKFEEGEEYKKPPVADDGFQSTYLTAFITPRVHVETRDAEDEEDDHEDDRKRGGGKRQPAARTRLREHWVCHACGHIHEDRDNRPLACCHCREAGTVTLQHVLRDTDTQKGRRRPNPARTCPACNATNPHGEILALLRSGVASSTSVLTTHHLDLLEADERKILVFADNRQEAAHQAGYINDRHRIFALRHAVQKAVEEAGSEGIALPELPWKVLEIFQQMGLAWKRLGKDVVRNWIKVLEEHQGLLRRGGSHRGWNRRLVGWLRARAFLPLLFELRIRKRGSTQCLSGLCNRDGGKRRSRLHRSLRGGAEHGDLLVRRSP